MTQSLMIASTTLKANSFQKQRSKVILTRCFDFSFALGHFNSKIDDILSALCCGESVGTSSVFSADLYPSLNNGFIQIKKTLDNIEAEAKSVTSDFPSLPSYNLVSSSTSCRLSSVDKTIPVDPLTPAKRRNNDKGSEMKETTSSTLKSLLSFTSTMMTKRITAETVNNEVIKKFTTQ
ncbi:hypothetical protein V8G54_017978 [Vigna mungo]|uniref:Uncharacterized protein n=1 Tax=Vigna mungo TaxID=3915 RepID=A0AAQ3N822_VIGMU